MTNVERIVAEVKELSEDERQRVADQILELVPTNEEIAAVWMKEAERRFEELDKDRVGAVPWSKARKHLFENH